MGNEEELDIRTVVACELIGRVVLFLKEEGMDINKQSIIQQLSSEQRRRGRDDIRQQFFAHAIDLLSRK
ncbi:DUF2767 family protein [Salmonella enterica subsp. enterica serovar Saintpaul]|nr:DUF2767 family protein [Salmonella enterica subsp. enterica serovar Saintpaul]